MTTVSVSLIPNKVVFKEDQENDCFRNNYLWVRLTDLEKPRAVQPGSHNITKISDVLGLETH